MSSQGGHALGEVLVVRASPGNTFSIGVIADMTITIGALLALSFLISVLGLFMFIWAQTNGLMQAGPGAAQVLFAKGEVGLVEEPSISPTERAALQQIESKASGTSDDALQSVAMSAELAARVEEDRSSRTAAFALLTSSIFWLLLGSLAGRRGSVGAGEGHLTGHTKGNRLVECI